MRFFFAAYCPTGNTAPGSGYCPAGNTPTLFVYCGCAAIRLTFAPIAPRAIRRRLRLLPCGQYAYAVRLLRLRRNTTHPCAYCPTGNTALASGYCPAGNTPTLFVYCGYAAIRLTYAPIAPQAIRRRHEQKKAQPNGCAQKCACKAIIRINLISISYRWASNRKRPFP